MEEPESAMKTNELPAPQQMAGVALSHGSAGSQGGELRKPGLDMAAFSEPTSLPSGRSSKTPPAKEEKKKSSPPAHKGPPKLLIVPVVLALIGFGVYKAWQRFQPEDRTKLAVSGRIDGYETNIGAKIAGRVAWIGQREGDLVHPGQAVVKLSDEDIQAQLRGAQARLRKAMSAREQAAQQVQVAENSIAEAKLTKEQSIGDAQGRILQAGGNVAAAEANMAQAKSNLEEALADYELAHVRKERYTKLAKQGAVSQDDADQAKTNEATTAALVSARRAGVESARKQLVAAQGGLTQATTNKFNPGIRTQQLLSAQRQLLVAQAALQSANDEIENSQASVDEIKANIAYLNLTSTINGVVTARAVEPGAVVSAGQTVLSLINLDTVFLRAYVQDREIGRVRVGEKADVYLDSDPTHSHPLHGKVISIDPVASFTPENIYFKDDRVKQTFGIKIGLDNPQGFAKPGLPADATVFTPEIQETDTRQARNDKR